MKLVMLVEPKMEPVPKTIKVLEHWGIISIHTTEGEGLVVGDHMMLEGTDDAFMEWLRDYEGVWLGIGPPQFQQFEVHHIKT